MFAVLHNDDIDDNIEKLFIIEKVTSLVIAYFDQAVDSEKDVVIDETMILWQKE